MGINAFKIKKWTLMIFGKSIYHVNQGVGKVYSIDKVEGYYNDMTEKVTRGQALSPGEVPITVVDSGEKIYFSIAIFQYGLGAYDLYLINKDLTMLNKMIDCANWAVNNQENNGAWNTFFFENEEHPYSSMAQGEGISLLLRAYEATKSKTYLECAEKALNFMILPVNQGGTTKYYNEDVYFYECTNDPLILNGWIFSIWGLFDYIKIVNNSIIIEIYQKTLLSLIKDLPKFDLGYWSKYELGKRISSPFYHKLHIAQLEVMYHIVKDEKLKACFNKWSRYQENWFNKTYAFIIKATQKIIE